MSLNSWKEEFYPIVAEECQENYAIEHSLQKWIGLRPENLKKHDIKRNDFVIGDEERILEISTNTCALCVHYYDTHCIKCPLFEVRGVSCDNVKNNIQEPLSPYHHFMDNGNPEPMIELIQIALKRSKE